MSGLSQRKCCHANQRTDVATIVELESSIAKLQHEFDYISLVEEESPQCSVEFWEKSYEAKMAILKEKAALEDELHRRRAASSPSAP